LRLAVAGGVVGVSLLLSRLVRGGVRVRVRVRG
jgi:hypothetical protein